MGCLVVLRDDAVPPWLSAKLVASIIKDRNITELAHPQITLMELRRERLKAQTDAAARVKPQLSPDLRRLVDLASQKGASSWLTALPLQEHGFALSKGTFRDALRLRYGWQLDNLPTECVCGAAFTPSHALHCPSGGYPTIRHNQVRDFLAPLMGEFCTDVKLEPTLQPLSGETFTRKTT